MDGLIAYALAKKYTDQHSGLPTITGSGSTVVSVNNEWKAQDGYGFTNTLLTPSSQYSDWVDSSFLYSEVIATPDQLPEGIVTDNPYLVTLLNGKTILCQALSFDTVVYLMDPVEGAPVVIFEYDNNIIGLTNLALSDIYQSSPRIGVKDVSNNTEWQIAISNFSFSLFSGYELWNSHTAKYCYEKLVNGDVSFNLNLTYQNKQYSLPFVKQIATEDFRLASFGLNFNEDTDTIVAIDDDIGVTIEFYDNEFDNHCIRFHTKLNANEDNNTKVQFEDYSINTEFSNDLPGINPFGNILWTGDFKCSIPILSDRLTLYIKFNDAPTTTYTFDEFRDLAGNSTQKWVCRSTFMDSGEFEMSIDCSGTSPRAVLQSWNTELADEYYLKIALDPNDMLVFCEDMFQTYKTVRLSPDLIFGVNKPLLQVYRDNIPFTEYRNIDSDFYEYHPYGMYQFLNSPLESNTLIPTFLLQDLDDGTKIQIIDKMDNINNTLINEKYLGKYINFDLGEYTDFSDGTFYPTDETYLMHLLERIVGNFPLNLTTVDFRNDLQRELAQIRGLYIHKLDIDGTTIGDETILFTTNSIELQNNDLNILFKGTKVDSENNINEVALSVTPSGPILTCTPIGGKQAKHYMIVVSNDGDDSWSISSTEKAKINAYFDDISHSIESTISLNVHYIAGSSRQVYMDLITAQIFPYDNFLLFSQKGTSNTFIKNIKIYNTQVSPANNWQVKSYSDSYKIIVTENSDGTIGALGTTQTNLLYNIKNNYQCWSTPMPPICVTFNALPTSTHPITITLPCTEYTQNASTGLHRYYFRGHYFDDNRTEMEIALIDNGTSDWIATLTKYT